VLKKSPYPAWPMKKNPIPKTKETSAKSRGIKASRLSIVGIRKKISDTIIRAIPAERLYVLLSIIYLAVWALNIT
jgi:hypothetical protein